MSSKSVPALTQRSEKYEELKARADAEGFTVPEYLDREWERTRPRFKVEELIERIERRAPSFVGFDVVQAVQSGRGERETQIDEWLKDVRR